MDLTSTSSLQCNSPKSLNLNKVLSEQENAELAEGPQNEYSLLPLLPPVNKPLVADSPRCVPLRSSVEHLPVRSFLTEGRKDTQRPKPHVRHIFFASPCGLLLNTRQVIPHRKEQSTGTSWSPHPLCAPLRSSVQHLRVGSFLTEGRKEAQRTGLHVFPPLFSVFSVSLWFNSGR